MQYRAVYGKMKSGQGGAERERERDSPEGLFHKSLRY